MSKIQVENDPMSGDLAVNEELFRLNFETHYPDLVNFFRSSFDLTGHFIDSVQEQELSDVQKICVFFLSKGRRLLLTIYKLASQGYWPEAEILFRTFLEMQFLLIYMVEDSTDARFKKWMGRTKPHERWQTAEILKDFPEMKPVYSSLSLYAHNHVLSSSHHVQRNGDDILLDTGPLFGEDNCEKAKILVGLSAMKNGSIIEIVQSRFTPDPSFAKKYNGLISMPYYLDNASKIDPVLGKKHADLICNKLSKPVPQPTLNQIHE